MGKFIIGDVVVHKGVKMTIEKEWLLTSSKSVNTYDCIWFDEKNSLQRENFTSKQLVSLEDWHKIVLQKQRDRKIDDILNMYNKIYRL